MLRSLHIGRYLADPAELRVVAEFFVALGFERGEESEHSRVFAAPMGLLSLNALTREYAPEVRARLQDVDKLIVVEVANPDSVWDLVQRKKLKVLADSTGKKSGERSFTVELAGGIVVTVHGKPAAPVAAFEGDLDAKGKRFAVVVSRFNAFITERLLHGALDGLRRTGAAAADIEVVRVPGAFEIPSAARALAETAKYDALVCIGCLLRGDTAHYDVIVNECARGIGQSAQETGVPHAFGVLTCDTLEQAIDRAGLKGGNKGFEAGLGAIEMAQLSRKLRGSTKAPSASTDKRRRK